VVEARPQIGRVEQRFDRFLRDLCKRHSVPRFFVRLWFGIQEITRPQPAPRFGGLFQKWLLAIIVMQFPKQTAQIIFIQMKIPATIMAAVAAAAIALYGGESQAQPTAIGVNPNGNHQFQPAPKLSFAAGSPIGVTDFCLALTVISLQTGQSFMKTPTAATGLTFTGPATGLTAGEVF
jgi:hypothetical protein